MRMVKEKIKMIIIISSLAFVGILALLTMVLQTPQDQGLVDACTESYRDLFADPAEGNYKRYTTDRFRQTYPLFSSSEELKLGLSRVGDLDRTEYIGQISREEVFICPNQGDVTIPQGCNGRGFTFKLTAEGLCKLDSMDTYFD